MNASGEGVASYLIWHSAYYYPSVDEESTQFEMLWNSETEYLNKRDKSHENIAKRKIKQINNGMTQLRETK